MPIPNKPSYSHGSTGTEPSSKDYANGDPVDAENFDHFIYTPFKKIKEIIDALNEIKNGTITVGDADTAASATTADQVKGNDIDSDGDGKVNSADVADSAKTYKGNDIDSDGDGKVDTADVADSATTYKGNDIDSNGDGTVDAADDADTVDGQHATDLTEDINATSPSSTTDTSGTNSTGDVLIVYVYSPYQYSPALTGKIDGKAVQDVEGATYNSDFKSQVSITLYVPDGSTWDVSGQIDTVHTQSLGVQ